MAQNETPVSLQVSPQALAFERKVRLSRIAMYLEAMWPRLWLGAGIVALFLVISLAGLWGALGVVAHKIALALFAVACAGALASMPSTSWPAAANASAT